MNKIELKYTICFVIKQDKVLMIYRHKKPWQGRWNGIGGKVQSGESPKACLYREVFEETTIDLHEAKQVSFTGLVTWDGKFDNVSTKAGMYAFVVELANDQPIWEDEKEIKEGKLVWETD